MGRGTSASRKALFGDLSDSLSAVKSATNDDNADYGDVTGNRNDSSEFFHHCRVNNNSDYSPQLEQALPTDLVWQGWVKGTLKWAEVHSFEIYMIHGFFLCLLKMGNAPAFTDGLGIILVAINFSITVFLCWIVVRLININKTLNSILGFK